MVVGIRHTNSATNTVTVTGKPCPAAPTLYAGKGSSVAVVSRKMIVNAANRIARAISFGVFWRLAPSTIAIKHRLALYLCYHQSILRCCHWIGSTQRWKAGWRQQANKPSVRQVVSLLLQGLAAPAILRCKRFSAFTVPVRSM